MTNKTLYKKDKRSNWLKIAAICFSLFSLSGYVISSTSQHPSTSQIELVRLKINESIRRNISYEKSLAIEKNLYEVPFSHTDKIYSLLAHNMLTVVKLKTISKQFNSVKVVTRFVQIKIMPKGSDLPDNSSLIG